MARNHTQSLEKEACVLRDSMNRVRETADALGNTLLRMSSAMAALTPAAQDMSWSHPEAPPRPPPVVGPVPIEDEEVEEYEWRDWTDAEWAAWWGWES